MTDEELLEQALPCTMRAKREQEKVAVKAVEMTRRDHAAHAAMTGLIMAQYFNWLYAGVTETQVKDTVSMAYALVDEVEKSRGKQ